LTCIDWKKTKDLFIGLLGEAKVQLGLRQLQELHQGAERQEACPDLGVIRDLTNPNHPEDPLPRVTGEEGPKALDTSRIGKILHVLIFKRVSAPGGLDADIVMIVKTVLGDHRHQVSVLLVGRCHQLPRKRYLVKLMLRDHASMVTNVSTYMHRLLHQPSVEIATMIGRVLTAQLQ
jgi:hypothetical protein